MIEMSQSRLRVAQSFKSHIIQCNVPPAVATYLCRVPCAVSLLSSAMHAIPAKALMHRCHEQGDENSCMMSRATSSVDLRMACCLEGGT